MTTRHGATDRSTIENLLSVARACLEAILAASIFDCRLITRPRLRSTM